MQQQFNELVRQNHTVRYECIQLVNQLLLMCVSVSLSVSVSVSVYVVHTDLIICNERKVFSAWIDWLFDWLSLALEYAWLIYCSYARAKEGVIKRHFGGNHVYGTYIW